MNGRRRHMLDEAEIAVMKGKKLVEEVLYEEDGSYDRMPDSFKMSDRGDKMMDGIFDLRDAKNLLDDALESIKNGKGK